MSTSSPLGCPLWVISLPDSSRRPLVQAHLDGLGIPFEFIDAVRGREGMTDNREDGRHFSPQFSAGEVGCWRSHVRALKRVVSEKHPMVMIWEDDARIADLSLLHAQLDAFRRLATVTPWDWIKLFQVNKIEALWRVFSVGNVSLSVPFKRGFGSTAQVVTPSGAATFLTHSERFLYEPIDRYLDNTHRSQVDLLVSDLGSIAEVGTTMGSDIGGGRIPEVRSAFQKWLDSLAFRWAALKAVWRFRAYRRGNAHD